MASQRRTYVLAAALSAAAFVARKIILDNFAEKALIFCEFVQAQGFLGILVYTFAFAVWVVLCMPSTILEILPGFLFGTWTGFLVCMVGKNLGSFAAMILGRTLLAGYVKKQAEDWPVLHGIKAAVRQQGFVMILMVRTVMMPIAIKNYGLAAIEVPASTNISAAVLSGIPFCFMWVYIGSTTKSLVEILEGRKSIRDLDMPPWAMAAAAGLGFVFLGLGGVYVKRVFDAAMENAANASKKKDDESAASGSRPSEEVPQQRKGAGVAKRTQSPRPQKA